MNSQHPQESLLLAYVDGRLDGEGRVKAERLIESDPQAREFVAMLEKTKLPYREAFDTQLGDGLSDNLRTTIEQWSPQRAAPRFALLAVLLIGVGLGFGLSQWPGIDSIGSKSEPAWLAQVASYHELYVRETVAGAGINRDDLAQLTASLSAALDAPLHIPNLELQKLSFKRGQLLQIDGRALVQLAYLPDNGTPVALCITKNGAADAGFVSGQSHNLGYVNWSRNGVSYVILGALETETLIAAAENAAAQLL